MVAYIGGHGRSGSTLLGRLMHGLPGVCSVGEMRNVWSLGVLRDVTCGCGEPFSRCELWSAVGQDAFGGWTQELARHALSLRRRVDRVYAVPLIASGRGPAGFRRDAAEYTDILAALYRAIAKVSGAAVVLDGSKVPSAAYLASVAEAIDLRVIHLVRDSRGVAYSWAKSVQRTDRDQLMARSSPVRTAVRWEVFNGMVEHLGRRGVRRIVVRYEDLVARPAQVLGDLAEYLELSVASPDLDFVESETVELPVDHNVWGNPIRSSGGPQRLRLDEAWRTRLPPRQRALVTAASTRGLRRYGYLHADEHVLKSWRSGQ